MIKILWYTLQAFFVTLETFTAYLLLKYLNKKPLGMQTTFDQMIKDGLYIVLTHPIQFLILDLITEFSIPQSHYLASFNAFLLQTFFLMKGWQCIMILLIRYLSIFYWPKVCSQIHNLSRLRKQEPIIHLFDGISPSRHKQSFFIYQVP